MQQSRLSQAAEFMYFATCSLLVLFSIYTGDLRGWPATAWSVAFVGFIIAYAVGILRRSFANQGNRTGMFLVLVMTVCGFAMLYSTFYGTAKYVEIITLWVASRRLPYITEPRTAWIGTTGMAIAAIVLFAAFEGWLEALAAGAVTTAMLCFGVSRSFHDLSERQASIELSLRNAELLANRELLAENSRAAERLRISRDLHDMLGHHLAALSIQLDVAARRSQGPAAEHIREAHAITRLLLGDVRDAVGKLRHGGDLNVAALVRPLCRNLGDLRIHPEIDADVTAADATQADAIVRCVQEVVTNTLKHARARNLWIRITQNDRGVDIVARDDGRGVAEVRFGHGLTGMEERFAQRGGRVEVTSGEDGGFALHAFLPQPRETAAS
jgi:signal transduction histidine kinase